MGRKPYAKAILRLTPSDGIDGIDGTENNAVRRLALELLDRTVDDLSDLEVFGRQTDEAAFMSFCIEELRRLPSEVEPIMGCREWTLIQARSVVRSAQNQLMRAWSKQDKSSS